MADAHKNFAESLVSTAPSPATTGTSLVVSASDGDLFPTPPFNATVWPAGEQPTAENAEIIRVTNISTDTFTIIRKQESTRARKIIVGDQIAASITKQVLEDAENPLVTWSPFILSSGAASVVQTLAISSSQSSSGSLLVFPVTVNGNIQFNQAVLGASISYITSTNAGSNSYYSYFGLYSMNDSTVLSRIGSGSFSMIESYDSLSRTWNFPTTTMTSGYGYGSLAMSNTAEIVNYISGSRWFGLQFGSEMHLTNGIYYVGLLSIRSTANNSSAGMSLAGVIGQGIDAYHAAGSVSGYLPIGSAASAWQSNVTNSSQWWGRNIVGFVTATSITNFGGTAIPPAITLSALAATQTSQTVTILPAISFYSNVMT